MGVSFNEEANVFISDNLTIQQRKQLWSSGRNVIKRSAPLIKNSRKQVAPRIENKSDAQSRNERRCRIRNFVRFVVDEHKSLKAMGVNDTISLFRMSAACSKGDVFKAQQRASFGQRSAHVRSR